MKAEMKSPLEKPRRMAQIVVPNKHENMIRRAANRRAHVMTTHGKLYAGRKGRKG